MRFTIRSLLVLATALPGCLSCSDASGRLQSVVALTGDIEAGRAPYLRVCADCHGSIGQGNTGPLLVPSASLSDRAELAFTVLNGANSMPPAGAELTDQELSDLLAWLQSQR